MNLALFNLTFPNVHSFCQSLLFMLSGPVSPETSSEVHPKSSHSFHCLHNEAYRPSGLICCVLPRTLRRAERCLSPVLAIDHAQRSFLLLCSRYTPPGFSLHCYHCNVNVRINHLPSMRPFQSRPLFD